MSKKTTFIIFITLLVSLLALWGIKDWDKIKKYFKKKITTKKDAIDYLVYINPRRDKNIIQSFDDAFVIAWANADKFNEATFVYNGKTYYSSTGKAKTN